MNVEGNVVLDIKDLRVEIGGIEVLKGISICIRAGEIHAIMGKNGSGKSTLAKVIVGHPSYTVTGGDILFKGESILGKSPEERAQMGIFLGFQYPIEIPGVSNVDFLRIACNARRKFLGLGELEPLEFFGFVKSKLDVIGLDESFLTRDVNEGFSGGEKKKNEILQMALLDTSVSILDEIDSGLDIDALRVVANGVNHLATDFNAIVLITHYQRLLDYIKPNCIHVMQSGRVVKTGAKELALTLEEKGYSWLEESI